MTCSVFSVLDMIRRKTRRRRGKEKTKEEWVLSSLVCFNSRYYYYCCCRFDCHFFLLFLSKFAIHWLGITCILSDLFLYSWCSSSMTLSLILSRLLISNWDRQNCFTWKYFLGRRRRKKKEQRIWFDFQERECVDDEGKTWFFHVTSMIKSHCIKRPVGTSPGSVSVLKRSDREKQIPIGDFTCILWILTKTII